jgi:hypothetical protein
MGRFSKSSGTLQRLLQIGFGQEIWMGMAVLLSRSLAISYWAEVRANDLYIGMTLSYRAG